MTHNNSGSPATAGADHGHGTRKKYKADCRCMLCRAANASYESQRARSRRAGDSSGLVPASVAREHILQLSKQGVGRDAVAAASDIAVSIISRIKSGERPQIRKRTEDKLLSVTIDAIGDSALVPARSTWRKIHSLLRQGFTKAELARRLNYKSSSLQLGKKRILARNAARVDRLYRMLMKE